MICRGTAQHIDDCTGGTSTQIRRAVDHPRDARMDHRTGTHGARFHGHIERAAGQPVVAELACTGPQGLDLRVRAGITAADRPVPALADHRTFQHQHRTHRHFAGQLGTARQFQRTTHEYGVVNDTGNTASHHVYTDRSAELPVSVTRGLRMPACAPSSAAGGTSGRQDLYPATRPHPAVAPGWRSH